MRPFLDRIKSRKFLVAFFGAMLIVLNEGLELGIPNDTYVWFTGILATYILGESYVDGQSR